MLGNSVRQLHPLSIFKMDYQCLWFNVPYPKCDKHGGGVGSFKRIVELKQMLLCFYFLGPQTEGGGGRSSGFAADNDIKNSESSLD